jgi:hypothetical protein
VVDDADDEEEHKVQQEAAFSPMPMSYASADGAVMVRQAPERGHLPRASPATHVRRTSSSGHSTLSTGSQGSSGSSSSSSSLDSLDLPLCSYGSCSSTTSSSSSGEGGVYATVVLNLASPPSKAAAAAKMAAEGVTLASAAPAAEAPQDGVSSPISSNTAGVEASGRAEAGKQHRELPAGALDALRAHYQQQHWWPAAQLLLAALVSAFTLHPESYGPMVGAGAPPVDGAAAVAAGEGCVEVSSECFWRCTPRSAAVAWLQLPQ